MERLETEIFRILSKKHGLKTNMAITKMISSFCKEREVDQENLQQFLDLVATEWIQTSG
jgi:hypothetical protein